MSLWKSRRNKCCFNYLQLAWVKLIKHSLWLLTCANWCWMCHYWDSLTKFNIYYYESFASIIDDNNCSFFYLQKLLMSMPGEIIWFKRLILGSKLNSRLQRWVDWVMNLNYQFILGLFIRTSLRQHIRHALWHLILIWVLVHCRVGWLNSSVIIEYCLNSNAPRFLVAATLVLMALLKLSRALILRIYGSQSLFWWWSISIEFTNFCSQTII